MDPEHRDTDKNSRHCGADCGVYDIGVAGPVRLRNRKVGHVAGRTHRQQGGIWPDKYASLNKQQQFYYLNLVIWVFDFSNF